MRLRELLPLRLVRLHRAAPAVAAFVLLACAGSEETRQPSAQGRVESGAALAASVAGADESAAAAATVPVAGALGDGLVVWESNRDGNWRIWSRPLAPGSAPRRLSPDEAGRVHCCAHLSPDGTRLAYLSLPPGGETYAAEKSTGPLHLLDLASGEDSIAVPAARNYFENRAAVWRGDDELIYIGGDGRSYLLDLTTGGSRPLTERTLEAGGWLIDPELSYATRGQPSFSPYDARRQVIAERGVLGGCQPYFSSDGRWGFWVAGAGGPVNRLELASGVVSTILGKNDHRMVDGHGYAYFPMFSADRRAFAFAASAGEHSHVAADYEVFVAAADPDSLELEGEIQRITHHPATDRFPDIHLEPQALGRHDGEAPFQVDLSPPAGGDGWSFGFGHGAEGAGAADSADGRHVYRRPGLYRVTASRGGERLTGTVRVRPARAPAVRAVRLADGGREVWVTFDEEVAVGDASVVFASGLTPAAWSLADDGRSLRVRLDEALSRFDRLELAGVRDRAQEPNTMAPVTLDIEPPLWPARRDRAVFLWRTAEAPNLFPDPLSGVDRSGILEPSGPAFLDRHHRMVLRGGYFSAAAEESNRLRWILQGSNEMALELTVDPLPTASGRSGALAAFGRRGELPNFSLLLRDGELFYRQRVGPRGADAVAEAALGALAPGRRHLVLSYSPGRLTLDVDGERRVESAAVQGDFFHWRSLELTFGGQAGGDLAWSGAIEGVALYDRVVGAAEARDSFSRYRRLLERRTEVAPLVVEARLTQRSPTPSLAEIRPYRQALAVHEYAVERVIAGETSAATLRIAHWELLDGDLQPAAARRPGDRVTLRLEPFADQPQLASVYLANRFESPPAWFAADGD